MTKKDYELIARAFHIKNTNFNYPHLKSERSSIKQRYNSILDAEIQTARRLAMQLELDNPNFNRVKFLIACGLTNNQLMRYSEIAKDSSYNMFSIV